MSVCIGNASTMHESTLSATYDKVALVKGSTHLTCFVSISRWDSIRNILWQKENDVIIRHTVGTLQDKTNKYSLSISLQQSAAVLNILNLTFDDAGTYTCLIYFGVGKPEKVVWTLQIQGRPHLSVTEVVTEEDQIEKVSCCVKFAYKPNHFELRWVLDKTLNTTFYSIQNVFNTSSQIICSEYRFQSKTNLHGAVLSCLVNNEVNLSVSTTISVKYSPTVKVIHDFSLASPTVFLVLEGNTLNISCNSTGNPEPNVSLKKLTKSNQWRNVLVNPIYSPKQGSSRIYTFSLSNASFQDFQGIFRCSAVNIIGKAESEEFRIELKYSADVIIIKSSKTKFQKGDDVMIFCTINSNPLPQVKLQRRIHGKEWLTLSHQAMITTKDLQNMFTFVFVKAHENLDGKYRCFAKEATGKTMISEPITLEFSASKSFGQLLGENILVVIVVCLGVIVLFLVVPKSRLKNLLYANVSYFPTEPKRNQDKKTNTETNMPSLPSVSGQRRSELSLSNLPVQSNSYDYEEVTGIKRNEKSRDGRSDGIYTYVSRL